jgi:hypothetical protein
VLDLDLVAMGIKLVRDDGRETCERPLAEFDVLAKDRDGVVGRDTDERVRPRSGEATASLKQLILGLSLSPKSMPQPFLARGGENA